MTTEADKARKWPQFDSADARISSVRDIRRRRIRTSKNILELRATDCCFRWVLQPSMSSHKRFYNVFLSCCNVCVAMPRLPRSLNTTAAMMSDKHRSVRPLWVVGCAMCKSVDVYSFCQRFAPFYQRQDMYIIAYSYHKVSARKFKPPSYSSLRDQRTHNKKIRDSGSTSCCILDGGMYGRDRVLSHHGAQSLSPTANHALKGSAHNS